MFHTIISFVAHLLAVGGGSVAVAYLTFQWLGKGWLNHQFEKQLERFKHEQEKELEHIRHEINSTFSRISKIHEKEFEVLPMAWKLLHEANGRVFQVASTLQKYPNFDRMSEPQFEEYLRGCRLPEFQKDALRNAEDKLKFYQEAIFWVELAEAKNIRAELNNYLALNSIFMTESLRQQFREINKGLASVLISEEVSHEAGYTPELRKSIAGNLNRISGLFASIESEVQKRLRYYDA